MKKYLIFLSLLCSFFFIDNVKAYYTYNNVTFDEELISSKINNAWPNDNIELDDYYVVCGAMIDPDQTRFFCNLYDVPVELRTSSSGYSSFGTIYKPYYQNEEYHDIIYGIQWIPPTDNTGSFKKKNYTGSTSQDTWVVIKNDYLYTNYDINFRGSIRSANLDFNTYDPITFNFHLNGGYVELDNRDRIENDIKNRMCELANCHQYDSYATNSYEVMMTDISQNKIDYFLLNHSTTDNQEFRRLGMKLVNEDYTDDFSTSSSSGAIHGGSGHHDGDLITDDFSISLTEDEFYEYMNNNSLKKFSMVFDGLFLDENLRQSFNYLDLESNFDTSIYTTYSENLFIKENARVGYEIVGNNISSKSGWFVTDYIEVVPGDTYSISKSVQEGSSILFYNSSKSVVTKTSDGNHATFTVPSNSSIKYAILNSPVSNIDNLEIKHITTEQSSIPSEIDLYVKWRYQYVNDFLDNTDFITYNFNTNYDYAIINRGNNGGSVYLGVPFKDELEIFLYDEVNQSVDFYKGACLVPLFTYNDYYYYDLNVLNTDNQEVLIIPKSYFSFSNYSFYLTSNAYIHYTNDLSHSIIVDSNGNEIDINLNDRYQYSLEYRESLSNNNSFNDSKVSFKNALNMFSHSIKFIFRTITNLFNNYLGFELQHYFYLVFCLTLLFLIIRVIF